MARLKGVVCLKENSSYMWTLTKGPVDRLVEASCSIWKETLMSFFLNVFSWEFWAPRCDCYIVPWYSREGRHLYGRFLPNPEIPTWMNTTAGGGKLCACVCDLGLNCHFNHHMLNLGNSWNAFYDTEIMTPHFGEQIFSLGRPKPKPTSMVGQLCVLHCLDANGAKMLKLPLIDRLRHVQIMENYK